MTAHYRSRSLISIRTGTTHSVIPRFGCQKSFRTPQHSRRPFVNLIQFGRSHELVRATHITYDHAVVAFSRGERDVAIDDIMQHHLYRAQKGVAVAAAAGRIELDALARRDRKN